ncbi:sigma-70 family RNA polymerase sigma factor [Streptomyces sp. uw30]|uniref:sigma-70 family RNA polymerase sigma factor n=1 Tax=Streptomyces sp. uw30 TaxID=1828179 RepID=UPI0011CDD5A8|nr:sigma-70 family RNA polymerase sigma factor [Streptomyces sp. uw30]TXS52509.1 sigma-70 family RNA polymerase sigma factor [Streptomyces sp. uw30]
MTHDTLNRDGRPGCHGSGRCDNTRAEQFIRAVYDQHGAFLLRVATGLLAGDSHHAQDLVQETVLRAWRHADSLDPQAMGIRSWLGHVLRNLVIDGRRARRRRPPETTDEVLVELPVSDHTETLHTAKVVREALAGLSLQHREVLVHVLYLDQSVARTAKTLGIPPGTVKSRTHLALKALRTALAERGYVP